jgi:hypothetical protein
MCSTERIVVLVLCLANLSLTGPSHFHVDDDNATSELEYASSGIEFTLTHLHIRLILLSLRFCQPQSLVQREALVGEHLVIAESATRVQ